MINRYLLAIAILFSFIVTSAALAVDADDAKNAANTIMTKMARGNYKSIWDDHMSEWWKSKLTKDSFLANLAIGRSTLGKRVNSKFIDMAYTKNDPASGYYGDIYAFTYTNKYQGATLYERVVVINEDGNGFKLSGYFVTPVK